MKISRTSRRIEEARAPKPSRPRVTAEDLIALIGERNTVKVCYAFGGGRVPYLLPYLLRRRREAILQRYVRGEDIPYLAVRFAMTVPAVRRIVRPHGPAQRNRVLAFAAAAKVERRVVALD